MSRHKFDDCVTCKFVRSRRVCGDCDFGEQYEHHDGPQELNFEDEGQAYARAGKSLVTEDDEPFHNPDDLVARIDTNAENEEESNDE